MAIGAVKNILVCAATADASTVAPCPEGQGPQMTSAFLIESSQADAFNGAFEPINASDMQAFWGSPFVLIITIYLFSKYIGQIIGMVKSLWR